MRLIVLCVYSKLEQPFQYYLCFDVEATCDKGVRFNYMNEIIEFPILLLESKTFEIASCYFQSLGLQDLDHRCFFYQHVLTVAYLCIQVDVFHSYVKPSKKPVLSDFCKELTGISQVTFQYL